MTEYTESDCVSQTSSSQITSVTVSMNAMIESQERHKEVLRTLEDFDFDCFKVCEVLGREHFFSTVIFKMMNELPRSGDSQTANINNDKLISFLRQI